MYWSPKQFSLRMQDILLVFYINTNTYHTSMKFTSTFTWFMFYKCLWFIYHFYRVYIFHSLRTQIHARITDPVTLIHTNDEWIGMTFTRNYINKSWSDHAWLIIQGLKHNNQWSNNDLPFFILASKHFFLLVCGTRANIKNCDIRVFFQSLSVTFVFKKSLVTRLITAGIIYLISVAFVFKAALVSRLGISGILFSISLAFVLRTVVVIHPITVGILFSISVTLCCSHFPRPAQ